VSFRQDCLTYLEGHRPTKGCFALREPCSEAGACRDTAVKSAPVSCICGGRTLTDVRSRRTKDFMSWVCPRCDRTFRQVNQRHACGAGSAATLLKSRPPALTDLYRKLETTVRGFGEVEVVTGDRYALFRTTRIFANLTVTRDALRVVVHLGRKVSAPYFNKIGPSGNRVSHVVLVRTAEDLRTVMPFLREAFELAVSEKS
jgi:DNA-directed RNA polymerase subunit RPC12/RpoP